MRKVLILILAILMIAHPSWAFLYKVEVKDKEAIGKFSDDILTDVFIDVIVELEASKSFHEAAGFHPREYEKHKSLLRYRILLMQELKSRGLDVPGSGYLHIVEEDKGQKEKKK